MGHGIANQRRFSGQSPLGSCSRQGSDHVLLNHAVAVWDLPRLAEHADTVRILVFHREMVKDVPVTRGGVHLASSDARNSSQGMGADRPVHDVEVMDVLLDIMIAR